MLLIQLLPPTLAKLPEKCTMQSLLATINPFNAKLLFQIAAVRRVQHHTGLTHYFYRTSICKGGLGSRNSARPSVCLSHACIVTKLNDALQIFLYHTKRQSLCYSDTKSGWSATPPSLWNLRSK